MTGFLNPKLSENFVFFFNMFRCILESMGLIVHREELSIFCRNRSVSSAGCRAPQATTLKRQKKIPLPLHASSAGVLERRRALRYRVMSGVLVATKFNLATGLYIRVMSGVLVARKFKFVNRLRGRGCDMIE